MKLLKLIVWLWTYEDPTLQITDKRVYGMQVFVNDGTQSLSNLLSNN